jgi:endonuclease/exonuclease/phosphatase family metal-dependent hydrolase
MSYNVHHCNPPAKPEVIDLDAIAKVITDANPDLVGLQEIDVNTARSGKNINQAETLAKKTGMYYYFAKAIDHDGGDYGIAILSKYPIKNPKTYPLSNVKGIKGEPRVLAVAEIELSKKRHLIFANTHLDAGKDHVIRLAQIKDINAIAAQEKLPFLLTGDFNALPSSAVISIMDQTFTRTCANCPPTIPADKPRNSIDFIAFKKNPNIKVISHSVVNAAVESDHLPVVTELHLP